jgi:hypothetical protein
VTPLKDRFGAEIRTHYPLELDDELELIAQEAVLLWDGSVHAAPLVPSHLLEVIGRFARAVRVAPHIDQRSGVSARFAIAAVETVAASAGRRAALTEEAVAVAGWLTCRAWFQLVAARSSSTTRTARSRGGSSRCWSICCAGPSPRPTGLGWPGWTCVRCRRSSTAGCWCPPATRSRLRISSNSSVWCPRCQNCSTGSSRAGWVRVPRRWWLCSRREARRPPRSRATSS